MRTTLSFLASLCLAASFGCSSEVTGSDAGFADAAASQDARPPNADAAPAQDAVVNADAATNADAAADQDAAPGTDAPAGDSGLLPFGATCTMSSECESNLCFNFNARGMLCTYQCTNGMCPVAGVQCNGMGVCRPN